MKHPVTFLLLAILAGTTNVGAMAQGDGIANPGSTGSLGAARMISAKDKQFINESAMLNLLEVKLGEVALQKAQSAEVKAFAQRMIKDHGDAQQRLEEVARSIGISLPTTLDTQSQYQFDKLSTLSGRNFDAAYIDFNVKAHSKTVRNMKNDGRGLQNQTLRTWNEQTLPTVEGHYSLAQQTDRQLGNGTQNVRPASGGSSSY